MNEKHSFEPTVFLTGAPLPNLVPTQTFKSLTPEATLTWKPASRTTAFLTYRKGNKSGGYNIPSTTVSFGPVQTFDEETVEGFELGVKSVVADGQLRFDGTLYHYKYSDMQVGSFDPATVLTTVTNAASAKAYGAEFGISFEPRSIDGLSLGLKANYSDARYGVGASTSCYAGQSIASGCNLGLNPVTGRFTLQDLQGIQLPRASDWTGNLDVQYEGEVSGPLRFAFGATVNYLSAFNPTTDYDPITRQGSQATLDANLRLFDDDDGWEVAVLGKNLTQERFVFNGFPRVGTGAGATTGTAAGGLSADFRGVAYEPRTITVRLTKRW